MNRTGDTASHDPFDALADPTRRSILEMLRRGETRTAGAIAKEFPNISRPAVSPHLRVLRQAGLVTAEGVGREQRYRINGAALAKTTFPLYSLPVAGEVRSVIYRRTTKAISKKRAAPRGAALLYSVFGRRRLRSPCRPYHPCRRRRRRHRQEAWPLHPFSGLQPPWLRW